MSKFELKLPRMGESVAEATLTAWLKEVGEEIEMDEPVLEIATDKVDSEVPSEVEGILVEKLFSVDDVIKVGQTIAIIEVKGESSSDVKSVVDNEVPVEAVAAIEETIVVAKGTSAPVVQDYSATERFYSPLVKNIAKKEGITIAQLDTIKGTGKEARVTKNDILAYIENGKDAKPKSTCG